MPRVSIVLDSNPHQSFRNAVWMMDPSAIRLTSDLHKCSWPHPVRTSLPLFAQSTGMLVFKGPTSSHITTAYQCAFFLLVCTQAAHATNFTECFTRLQNEGTTTGGTLSDGSPAPIEEATGITYRLCLSKCGSEQEAFSWNTFSQQFNAWLLPWLALISQLPFGANLRVDNLVSVLLTVGSPTLAAYSIAITALNGQWVSRRFQVFTYPNAKKMSRILAGLQQAPLKVNQDKALLASLVILPENDEWFTELATFIEFEHTWSISAATNIGWVLVAYLFTVADSFDDVTRMVNSNGQAVGSLWLWVRCPSTSRV